MAKKPTAKPAAAKNTTEKPAARKPAPPAGPVSSTPVRNSAIPKSAAAPAPKPALTHEAIARRAYEIFLSGAGGSEFDNWIAAEQQLRRELGL